MLKIGEFSRLSRVTVKALRYYDEIGLLKAAYIDPFTKHRYYNVDQLSHIHRIIALKELGLSLQQIGQMLNDSLDIQQIRGMLKLKQAEIQQHVQEEQARLNQVAFRINMIEVEHKMPDIEIVVKQQESFRALTLRRKYESASEFQRIGEQLMFQIEATGVKIIAPPLEIYYGEEFTFTDLDVELAGPVDDEWTEDMPVGEYGTFVVRKIQVMETAATYMHKGSLENLPQKLAIVQRWAIANSYRLCDEMRLVYHRGPLHYQDENNLIEVQSKIEIT